jgi:hypothetical protein
MSGVVNAAGPNNCSLHFLFSVGEKLYNEHLWTDFFRGASAHSQYKYRVFMHFSASENNTLPHHLKVLNVPGRYFSGPSNATSCNKRFDGVGEMLSTALSTSKREGVYFVLSGDSIPVKSFAETHRRFCGTAGGDNSTSISASRGGSTTINTLKSAFCIKPSTAWMKASSGDATEGNITITHEPWVILTQSDAVKIVAQLKDNQPSTNQLQDTTICFDSFLFYKVLYGDVASGNVAVSHPGLDIRSVKSQGGCHTFSYDPQQNAVIINDRGLFRENTTAAANSSGASVVVNENGIFVNISMQMLADLRSSPTYYFVKGFRGQEAGRFISGANGALHTLQEAAHSLRFYGAAPHGHSGVSTANKGIIRRSGDNGGLRVLIVSADDREMKERLEDNDYVGMAAVLIEDYAKRHGYDFIKLASGNSTRLVDRVREKYKDNVKHLGKIGDTKYGPSCFHPGLQCFRASSWGKIPHVWNMVNEHSQHYDYVWVRRRHCCLLFAAYHLLLPCLPLIHHCWLYSVHAYWLLTVEKCIHLRPILTTVYFLPSNCTPYTIYCILCTVYCQLSVLTSCRYDICSPSNVFLCLHTVIAVCILKKDLR